MRFLRSGRRRVFLAGVVTVLGLLTVVGVTSVLPANAGVGRGTCGAPGRPHGVWYSVTPPPDPDSSYSFHVMWNPPLDTILGSACTPVTGYYVYARVLPVPDPLQFPLPGPEDGWFYWTFVSPGSNLSTDYGPALNHAFFTTEFRVYAVNRFGWSAPYQIEADL
jgi:hypothetical protein